MSEPLTFPETYRCELDRVRELLSEYESLAGLPRVNVTFAVAALRMEIRCAEKAMANQDLAGMVRCLASLRERS